MWEDLNNHERELRREAFQLREIWAKTCELHSLNEEDREKLEKEAKLEFLPASDRIVLNVGGQTFETTVAVLTKDRWSILAALCKKKPPLEPVSPGTFFIDRDFWIFHHILQFLRTDALPRDPAVLLELYNEANFYRLASLCQAIRDLPGLDHARFPSFTENGVSFETH